MAWVIWFTGLPGCGKTTVARRTKSLLEELGVRVRILQLDEIRSVITPKPRYTEEERDIVYASLAYMAKLLNDEGVNVIVDATANRRRYRDLARELIPHFGEAYVKAPIDICMEREKVRVADYAPKGIYDKAAKGATVPGVNVAYEEPFDPEIEVDSSCLEVEEAAEHVARRIVALFVETEPLS